MPLGPSRSTRKANRYHAVVNKGPETQDTFVQRILGKDKSERLPILALNDEGHHCWRPISDTEDGASLTAEERQALKDEAEEARVWLDGLDRINNCGLAGAGKPGSRSRSICRQGRLHQGQQSSQGPILSAAGQRFRAGGRDRERDRQDSALPPDGRTPNFSAFGSASRNACNRVSPARNAVSRQAPTPQPSSRGSARSWPCRAMENGREIHPRPSVLASSKIQARILRGRHSLDTHDPPCDIAGASAACVTTGAE